MAAATVVWIGAPMDCHGCHEASVAFVAIVAMPRPLNTYE